MLSASASLVMFGSSSAQSTVVQGGDYELYVGGIISGKVKNRTGSQCILEISYSQFATSFIGGLVKDWGCRVDDLSGKANFYEGTLTCEPGGFAKDGTVNMVIGDNAFALHGKLGMPEGEDTEDGLITLIARRTGPCKPPAAKD